jgi:hypothetical protein
MFYLDGPGGTGKTFLLNNVIDALVINNKDYIIVASTGVAALLLAGGQTTHSAFRLSIAIDEETICNLNAASKVGKMLLGAHVIIWDKIVTMHNKSNSCCRQEPTLTHQQAPSVWGEMCCVLRQFPTDTPACWIQGMPAIMECNAQVFPPLAKH